MKVNLKTGKMTGKGVYTDQKGDRMKVTLLMETLMAKVR
jgi:hypothetical protein